MASDKAAGNIACRFNTEVIEIHRFTSFIKAKSSIHLSRVLDLNKILRKNRFHQLPVRNFLGTDHKLSSDEVQGLIPAIDKITPQIDQRMSELNRRIDTNVPVVSGGDFDGNLLSEWIGWFMDKMPQDPTAEDAQNLLQMALDGVERECDPAETDPQIDVIIDIALRYAMYHNVNGQLGTLQDVREHFEEVKIIAAAGADNAVTDIFRQAFVNLMAVFDAAIFDLVRLGLRRTPANIAGLFGKGDEKYTIDKILAFGTFDALKEDMISSHLKKRYVKELLGLLANEAKVECVDKTDGCHFGRLIEIVNRRNLHLHKRGIVDQRYLDDMNLDKLKLGEVARIDQDYWQLAKSYCTYCVRQVAIWADSQG